ncbi:hypothetical protein FACS1894166_12160 [Bacilli bacterium]|nr:hypothetical protein FACS1894166_12160 [Bacilli bacterium]
MIPDMTDNPENYTVICDGNVRIYNNETESTEVKNSQYNNIKTDEQYLLIKEKGVPMGECSLFVIRYGSSEHGEGLLQ